MVIQALLQLNYTVLFRLAVIFYILQLLSACCECHSHTVCDPSCLPMCSDLDTIWLKTAVRSMAAALDLNDADVVGAESNGTECPTKYS